MRISYNKIKEFALSKTKRIICIFAMAISFAIINLFIGCGNLYVKVSYPIANKHENVVNLNASYYQDQNLMNKKAYYKVGMRKIVNEIGNVGYQYTISRLIKGFKSFQIINTLSDRDKSDIVIKMIDIDQMALHSQWGVRNT